MKFPVVPVIIGIVGVLGWSVLSNGGKPSIKQNLSVTNQIEVMLVEEARLRNKEYCVIKGIKPEQVGPDVKIINPSKIPGGYVCIELPPDKNGVRKIGLVRSNSIGFIKNVRVTDLRIINLGH